MLCALIQKIRLSGYFGKIRQHLFFRKGADKCFCMGWPEIHVGLSDGNAGDFHIYIFW